mgnify:CR=1 FL=1
MNHLTYEERTMIEVMLSENHSLKAISRKLGRSPSTISREIKSHSTIIPRKTSNTCKNQYGCKNRHVCSSACRLKCRDCAKCIKYCSEYIPDICDKLIGSPYVCNGCSQTNCRRERKYYKAKSAQQGYESVLKDSRSGFNVTQEQLELIDQKISPLLKKGLSPYHVAQTIKYDIPISESTIYRMVNSMQLDARNIDLINKVKRKERNYKTPSRIIADSTQKEGHRYEDFLSFQSEHDYPVVEMDCVEGRRDDKAVLLTLHFVNSHMQLAFILDEHTSDNVVSALDKMETALGTDLFMLVCPLILTDNGHEFLKREEMERSCLNPGIQRTIVFYCEPNRSDEKGHSEKNHTHIRYVIPKGYSMEPYSQVDISLMMNHINSYYRKSLMGKTPYEVAMQMYPEDFFILLGLELIPPEHVLLKPSLLLHSD